MADELKQIKQLDLSTFTGAQDDVYEIDAVALGGSAADDYALKTWVEGRIAGKVDYLGVVTTVGELNNISCTMNITPGDYCRFSTSSTDPFYIDGEIIHSGDLLVAKQDMSPTNPGVPTSAYWDVIHTEDPGEYVTLATDQTITGNKTIEGQDWKTHITTPGTDYSVWLETFNNITAEEGSIPGVVLKNEDNNTYHSYEFPSLDINENSRETIATQEYVENKNGNISNTTAGGINGLQQKLDTAKVNFIGRNPNAEKNDPSLKTEFATGAAGDYSTSLNGNTMALGSRSLAINNKTIAIAAESFAQGYQSVAGGESSFAGGEKTYTTGTAAVSLGSHTQALANHATALGKNTIAKDVGALATGQGTIAEGEYSQTGGAFTITKKGNAYAGGKETLVDGYNAFGHGQGLLVQHDDQTAFGKFNLDSPDALLEIGCGEMSPWEVLSGDDKPPYDEFVSVLQEPEWRYRFAIYYLPAEAEAPDGLIPIYSEHNISREEYDGFAELYVREILRDDAFMVTRDGKARVKNLEVTNDNDLVNKYVMDTKFSAVQEDIKEDIKEVEGKLSESIEELQGSINTIKNTSIKFWEDAPREASVKQVHATVLAPNSLGAGYGYVKPDATSSVAMNSGMTEGEISFAANENTCAKGFASAAFGGHTTANRPYQLACGYNNEGKEDTYFEVGSGQSDFTRVAVKPTYDEAVNSGSYYYRTARLNPDSYSYKMITPAIETSFYADLAEVYQFNGTPHTAFEVKMDGSVRAYKTPEDSDDVIRLEDLTDKSLDLNVQSIKSSKEDYYYTDIKEEIVSIGGASIFNRPATLEITETQGPKFDYSGNMESLKLNYDRLTFTKCSSGDAHYPSNKIIFRPNSDFILGPEIHEMILPKLRYPMTGESGDTVQYNLLDKETLVRSGFKFSENTAISNHSNKKLYFIDGDLMSDSELGALPGSRSYTSIDSDGIRMGVFGIQTLSIANAVTPDSAITYTAPTHSFIYGSESQGGFTVTDTYGTSEVAILDRSVSVRDKTTNQKVRLTPDGIDLAFVSNAAISTIKYQNSETSIASPYLHLNSAFLRIGVSNSTGTQHYGTAGQVLMSDGDGHVVWGNVSGGGGSGSADGNYYHTPTFSTGVKIANGTGVNNLYVPYASASQAGVIQATSASVTPNPVYTIAPNSNTVENYGVYTRTNGIAFVSVQKGMNITEDDTVYTQEQVDGDIPYSLQPLFFSRHSKIYTGGSTNIDGSRETELHYTPKIWAQPGLGILGAAGFQIMADYTPARDDSEEYQYKAPFYLHLQDDDGNLPTSSGDFMNVIELGKPLVIKASNGYGSGGERLKLIPDVSGSMTMSMIGSTWFNGEVCLTKAHITLSDDPGQQNQALCSTGSGLEWKNLPDFIQGQEEDNMQRLHIYTDDNGYLHIDTQ